VRSALKKPPDQKERERERKRGGRLYASFLNPQPEAILGDFPLFLYHNALKDN
jgi:hypothetical protein